MEGNDFSIYIGPTNLSPHKNGTKIDLNNCEQKLKNYYNISNSSNLTIVQLETDNNDLNTLFNDLEFKIYDENKRELNLSICKDVNIDINYEIKENNSFDYTSWSYFNDLGINVLDVKDIFFNDICFPVKLSGDDLILEDRRKDIYQNISLCQKDCQFKGINLEKKVTICNCKTKQNYNEEIKLSEDEQFKEISLLDSNIGVIKCYKLVFSFKDKLKNIGFWIFTILLIINLILLILYIFKGINPIKKYLLNEMIKYGYLKNKNINFGDKNNIINLENNKERKKKNKKIINPIKKKKK
jgi:hypothetical protein